MEHYCKAKQNKTVLPRFSNTIAMICVPYRTVSKKALPVSLILTFYYRVTAVVNVTFAVATPRAKR